MKRVICAGLAFAWMVAVCCGAVVLYEYNAISAENKQLADTNATLQQTCDDLMATCEDLRAENETLANQEPQVIYQTEYVEVPAEDEYIECGTCGAHVHDWYYVTATMGEPRLIGVCYDCYQCYLDYYNSDEYLATLN